MKNMYVFAKILCPIIIPRIRTSQVLSRFREIKFTDFRIDAITGVKRSFAKDADAQASS